MIPGINYETGRGLKVVKHKAELRLKDKANRMWSVMPGPDPVPVRVPTILELAAADKWAEVRQRQAALLSGGGQ